MASIDKRIRDGQVTWLARWRDPPGRQRKRTFPRKADAERFLTTVEHSVLNGSYVDPGRSRVTVGDWSVQWLDGQVQLTPSTRARYASVLRRQVLPRWGSVPLARVSHADVAAWVAALSASGLSPRTVHKAHRVLSLVLDLAVRDRRIAVNPASGVHLPRSPQGHRRFLTPQQVADLAAACGRDSLVVYVLAYCGLRYGELAALRVRDVDPLRRRLTVARSVTDVDGHLVFGDPKTHQCRQVPVPRFLVEALAAACAGRGPDELVFTSPAGGVLRNNNWRRRAFNPAAIRVGLDGLTPHELRHTAASLAVSAGANVKAVQRMLGHASAAMTLDVYSGLFGDDLDVVAERLDALTAEIVVPPVRPEPSVVALRDRREGS